MKYHSLTIHPLLATEGKGGEKMVTLKNRAYVIQTMTVIFNVAKYADCSNC